MKCCVKKCEAEGTRHADHEGADWYCNEHGFCAYCGRSVAHFQPVYIGNRDVWICDCVSARRSESSTPRPDYVPEIVPTKRNVVEFGKHVAMRKKKIS